MSSSDPPRARERGKGPKMDCIARAHFIHSHTPTALGCSTPLGLGILEGCTPLHNVNYCAAVCYEHLVNFPNSFEFEKLPPFGRLTRLLLVFPRAMPRLSQN